MGADLTGTGAPLQALAEQLGGGAWLRSPGWRMRSGPPAGARAAGGADGAADRLGRSLPPDAIDLVHIRDWHDPGDPAQREHLQRFG